MSEFEEFEQQQGPKRRPGPNDELLALEGLSPEDRVQAIAEDPSLLTGQPFSPEAIEEAKRIAREGGLVRASELLDPEEDPLASLPQEPPDDDTPPDDTVPAFLVQRNKFGPGSHGVYLPDGRPVGIWLSEEYPGLSGELVTEMLLGLGMDEDLAGWYGKIRSSALDADQRLRRDPGVRQAMAQEAERLSAKQGVQKAFLDAHKRAKRDG